MIVAVLCCGLALTACNGGGKLQMNKKYILSYDVNNAASSQSYFIFKHNGTGQYYSHNESWKNTHYVINFKYTWVDDEKSAVMCFYDSHQALDGDNGEHSYVSSRWSMLLTVSKNVLMHVGTSGYTFYINKNYLKTISNFNVAE